jgi:hypothetical protein
MHRGQRFKDAAQTAQSAMPASTAHFFPHPNFVMHLTGPLFPEHTTHLDVDAEAADAALDEDEDDDEEDGEEDDDEDDEDEDDDEDDNDEVLVEEVIAAADLPFFFFSADGLDFFVGFTAPRTDFFLASST